MAGRPTSYKPEMVQTEVLQPYRKNAKKHPKKQIEQVAASIKEFGFNQPIVIDKNNVIIVGHGRLEAAKLLGLKEVPVLQADLTEEQAKAYRLADNKLNESEWDMELVTEELELMSVQMVELIGFDLQDDLGQFEAGTIDEQGRLDELKKYICPNCKHEGTASTFAS